VTRPVSFGVDAVDRSTGARAGLLALARGVVHTPVFMPVGTQAAIRSLPPVFLTEIGVEILLANTYHLHQRPGEQTVDKLGGLHRFMHVDVPILTDSGGFQVFSLAKKELSEQGVSFAYEVDGKRTFLSPEVSMGIQQLLASDIAMAFDECLPADATRATTEASVDLTARWAQRCVAAHTSETQSLFGIVQGGMFPDLRRRSAGQITALGFDGFAIGGLSVGEGPDLMNAVLAETTPLMPPELPRYLMGVGRPQDLVDGVALGVDMFDCVIPTRHARSGTLYTFQGRLRITHNRYRRDAYPIDTTCPCYTCRSFSRAYLNHLFAVGEVLGTTLCTIHNLTFFKELMGQVRAAIVDGTFPGLRRDIKALYPERAEVAEADEEQVLDKRAAAKRQATKRSARKPRGKAAGRRG
jgi:queuine tRNA-ribosyltransferase